MSTMRARLYRGPFNGKVMEWDGRRELYVSGSKRMSRKQRYERFMKAATAEDGLIYSTHTSEMYVRTGYVHPDGSIFYEWSRPKGG
jgi:hypothetical protein